MMLEAFGGSSHLNTKSPRECVFCFWHFQRWRWAYLNGRQNVLHKLKGKLPGCILEMRCILYLIFIFGSSKSHPAPKYGCGVGLELRVTLDRCLAGALCVDMVEIS